MVKSNFVKYGECPAGTHIRFPDESPHVWIVISRQSEYSKGVLTHWCALEGKDIIKGQRHCPYDLLVEVVPFIPDFQI